LLGKVVYYKFIDKDAFISSLGEFKTVESIVVDLEVLELKKILLGVLAPLDIS